MTEKRFTTNYSGDEHLFTHFLENKKLMKKGEVLNRLNELYEEKEEMAYYHKRQVDDKIAYKIRVKKVLKRYYDDYTQMAVDLRDDKYSNAMCHDVIEVLEEIADRLGVDLE